MGKKKGKKKKDKEAEKEGDAGDGAPSEPHPDAELIKLQFTIEDLKFKLEDSEKKREQLTISNTKHEKNIADAQKRHADIQFFLNQKLDHNYNEIERLEKGLINMKTEKEMADEESTQTYNKKVKELNEVIATMQLGLQKKNQELESLKQFIELKEDFGLKMSKMEAELQNAREDTNKQLVQQDKRRVSEKNKLQEEMEQKILETKQNAYQHSQLMLHSTTRDAIQENSRMSKELKYQTKAMEKLMRQTQSLKEESRRKQQEIDMHKQMQLEFAKKTQIYQRLLKRLNEKIQVKDDKNRDITKSMLDRDEKLSEELLSTDEALQTVNVKVEALESRLARTQENNHRLRKEMNRVKACNVQNFETHDELSAAEDVRHQMTERPDELFSESDFAPSAKTLLPDRRKGPPTSFSDLSLIGREKLVEILLTRLKSDKIELINQALLESRQSPRTQLPPLQGGRNGGSSFRDTTRQNNEYTFQSQTSIRSVDYFSGNANSERSISTNTNNKNALYTSDGSERLPASTEVVAGPLRKWGKRSTDLPLSERGSATFLKKNSPSTAKPWMNDH